MPRPSYTPALYTVPCPFGHAVYILRLRGSSHQVAVTVDYSLQHSIWPEESKVYCDLRWASILASTHSLDVNDAGRWISLVSRTMTAHAARISFLTWLIIVREAREGRDDGVPVIQEEGVIVCLYRASFVAPTVHIIRPCPSRRISCGWKQQQTCLLNFTTSLSSLQNSGI